MSLSVVDVYGSLYRFSEDGVATKSRGMLRDLFFQSLGEEISFLKVTHSESTYIFQSGQEIFDV